MSVLIESQHEGKTGPKTPLRNKTYAPSELLDDFLWNMEAKTDSFGIKLSGWFQEAEDLE